jgi:CBS domain-containing protein
MPANSPRRATTDDIVTRVLEPLGSLVHEPPVIVGTDTPMSQVRALLVFHEVAAVVVVDGDDTLRGLVTRTDALRAVDLDTPARAVMSRCRVVLAGGACIERAAALMASEHVDAVVVTRADATLIGLVTALDIARHLAVTAGYLGAA